MLIAVQIHYKWVGFNEANAMMIDVSSKFVANPVTGASTIQTTFFAIHI